MALRTEPTQYYARISNNPLENAFEDGRQAHPPSGSVPLDKVHWPQIWQEVLDTPRIRHGMAYVHIPFCENHCLFCGFYQNAWRPDAGAGYVDLVLKQARQFEGRRVLEGPPLRALYFGGGTPTALAADDIARLVRGLREILPLAPDCEITLEGRKHSFDREKAEAAFAAGVNRISLGVQTFDTKIRRALGRKADQAKITDMLEFLVAADAGAIVVDMMYGLPKQSFETWEADLDIVAQLGLSGVDHYGLNLIPGTPLMLSVEKGKLSPVPHPVLGEFYARGTERMLRHGWGQISTSHWRAPDLRERSVYNFGAKTGWDFFGLGAGAGGSLHGYGSYNTPMLERYAAQVEAGEPTLMGLSQASPLAPLLNVIRAGMERSRLDPQAIATGAQACPDGDGAAVLNLLEPLLAQWQQARLLDLNYGFYDLTLAGRFWQVQMTQRMTKLLSDALLPEGLETRDTREEEN